MKADGFVQETASSGAVRYGGLRRAIVTVREDGLLDVVREREKTGESIRGCATLEEALDAIYAHGGETLESVRKQRDVYREALQAIADDGCNDTTCVCCGLDQENAKAALRSGQAQGDGVKKGAVGMQGVSSDGVKGKVTS